MKAKQAKRGFTLVEMLVVIAVIGVLVGITVVALKGVLSSARSKRCESMKVVLAQGISTYYAQEGEWPEVIEQQLKKQNANEKSIEITNGDADKLFRDVVGKAFGKSGTKSMLLDATGLYVCEANRCGNGNNGCYGNHNNPAMPATYCKGKGCRMGVEFAEAVKRGSKRHIPLANMAFGYPDPNTDMFHRFKVIYNTRTDSVTVE